MSDDTNSQPFSTTTPAASFADLARQTSAAYSDSARQQQTTSLSANILQHTLMEYGPVISETTYQPPVSTSSNSCQIPGSNEELRYIPPTSLVSSSSATTSKTNSNSVISVVTIPQSVNFAFAEPAPAVTSAIMNPSMTNQPANIAMNPQPFGNNLDTLLYSPPLAPTLFPQPPLIPVQQTTQINPNSGRPISPKKPNKTFEDTMLGLQQKYRSLEDDARQNTLYRNDIERQLNDIARNAKGKNMELDEKWNLKKVEHKKCREESDRIKKQMRDVSDKLFLKFGYKITPSNATQRPGLMTHSRRAKMSTTPTPRRDETNNESKSSQMKRFFLELSDTSGWCQTCDLHLDTVAEYCQHLHGRDHTNKVRNPPNPWQNQGNQILSRRKTYDTLKSICAKVSNELEKDFTMAHLDAALNPTGDKEEIKKLRLNRERGQFSDKDPLFELRGMQCLIPIKGFYCIICDRVASCDVAGIDMHIKSYEHIYAHTKYIALDPQTEAKYRKGKVTSKKSQNQPERSTAIALSGERHALTGGYKKATSNIVDEHETIVDMFPAKSKTRKRPAISDDSDDDLSVRRKKESSESNRGHENPTGDENSKKRDSPKKLGSPNKQDSKKRRITHELPTIIPINESRKPAALKRLRQIETRDPIKEKQNADDDELIILSSEDEEPKRYTQHSSEIIPVSLEVGDPENPLPHLQISIGGNVHLNVLKDDRLGMNCRVVLKDEDFDQYKHMILNSDTLWERVDLLMTKKEKSGSSLREALDAQVVTVTKPTFFGSNGEQFANDLDDKKTVKAELDIGEKSNQDQIACDGPDIRFGEIEDEFEDGDFAMKHLEDFFIEK